MALPSQILIGAAIGTTNVEAVAFAADGHQLARAAVPIGGHATAGGGVEQDVGETWRVLTLALRQLARRMPGLPSRTVALAITGDAGGTWLLDEDGDPVAPAWSSRDRRAQQVVARWRQDGVARRVRAITGSTIEPSLRSAQLAWLIEHQPEVLDRAATAFAGKDCAYFFCTGERATDAATAAGAFGDWRTGTYDARVLELLGLADIARLLPEIVDGARQHGELGAAAAAATGLVPGTPVVLAPVDTVTAALALGLGVPGEETGGTVLGATNVHMRACDDLVTAEAVAGRVAVLPFASAGSWLGVLRQSGTTNVDWLVGLAEQLLLDAGLIGLPQVELRAMLERRAAEAAPNGVSYRPLPDAAGAGAAFAGLSADTTFYDLLRGIYEGLGLAARDGYAALAFRPNEVRVNATGPAGALAHECLAACLGVPVTMIEGETPAAAGAALVAAVSLGQYRDVVDGFRDWVEPRLGAMQQSKPAAPSAPSRAAPAPT